MIELLYTLCTCCSNLLHVTVTVCVFAFSRKDSFKVMCGTYLGRLTKIRIGHDNSGLGPGWFLNKASYFYREQTGFCAFLSLYISNWIYKNGAKHFDPYHPNISP